MEYNFYPTNTPVHQKRMLSCPTLRLGWVSCALFLCVCFGFYVLISVSRFLNIYYDSFVWTPTSLSLSLSPQHTFKYTIPGVQDSNLTVARTAVS